MSCGIYKIENLINHKIYIGQSNNIEQRWQHHKYESMNPQQVMYNYSIHRAFRKYGVDNFSFEIIEECLPEELDNKEIYYIQKYNSFNQGYNETTGGDKGPSLKGENNPKAKLTELDVIQIRNRILKKELPMEIFIDYKNKISKSTFLKIWRGETWKEVIPEAILLVHTKEHQQYIKSEVAKKEYKDKFKEV